MRREILCATITICLTVLCRDASCYMYSDYVWYNYGGHQYTWTIQVGPWETVKDEAVALGANLVTVNDATENAWLASTFAPISAASTGSNGVIWLGLYNDGLQWRWMDGEPVSYMASIVHGPFDTPGIHMYLHTDISPYLPPETWNNNNWHDNMLSHHLHGIIEIPGTLPPVPLPGAAFLGVLGLGMAGWRLRRSRV